MSVVAASPTSVNRFRLDSLLLVATRTSGLIPLR